MTDPIADAFHDLRSRPPVGPPKAGLTGVVVARQRVRRRRRVWAVLAGTVAVLAAVPSLGYGLRGRSGPDVVAVHIPSTTPTTTPGTTPATSSAASVPQCRGDELTASVQRSGGQASHALRVVALTNVSTVSCRVIGYVGLAAVGHTGAEADHDLALRVDPGGSPIMEDPGRRPVELAPNQSAYFGISTGLAYEGGATIMTITQLWILLEADQPGPVRLVLELPATAPAGEPIPIAVTALADHPIGS